MHISGTDVKGIQNVAILEQIKLIDLGARTVTKTDWLPYADIMEMTESESFIYDTEKPVFMRGFGLAFSKSFSVKF